MVKDGRFPTEIECVWALRGVSSLSGMGAGEQGNGERTLNSVDRIPCGPGLM